MTKFLQLVFEGTALGAQYALVALGFVVIYRATGVINFAQGGFLLLGAYLTYNFHVTWGLPFWISVAMAMVGGAVIGSLVEVLILRRMVGQPVFAVIMITIGLLFILQQVVTSIWGFDNLNLADPWGIDAERVGDVVLSHRNLWTLGLAALVLTGFFAVFRYTNLGVALMATPRFV